MESFKVEATQLALVELMFCISFMDPKESAQTFRVQSLQPKKNSHHTPNGARGATETSLFSVEGDIALTMTTLREP